MFISFISDLVVTDEFNIFIRLLIAIILGVVVGLSKELFVRSAGFRVSVIVALASCLITLVGIYQLQEALSMIIGGVLIASGLVTLGVINNNRGEYQGLISACMIILCSVIGITCASGLYFAAVCTTLLSVVVMFILKTTEKQMLNKGYQLHIIVDARNPVLKSLLQIFDNNHLSTSSIESKIVLFERRECVKIRVEFIRATGKKDIERVMPLIKEQLNALSVTLRNDTYGVIK